MGELVVSGCDASAVLDALEEVLDAVSLLVEVLVVGVLSLAVTPGRYDRIAALVDDLLVEPVGVVGLVGQDVLRRHAFDQVTLPRDNQ